MKKLIVVIMLLISSFSYYGAVDENGEKIADLQNVVGIENTVQDETIEIEVQESAEEIIVEEVSDTKKVEQVEVVKEQSKEETKVIQNVNTEITEQPKENEQPEVQSTVPNQEEISQPQQPAVVESNISNIQQPQQPTISNWCIEGGPQHIQGDGINEHGYYTSWDEAYQAFENDTQTWNACQFKIGQCACGKFYYWAIEN